MRRIKGFYKEAAVAWAAVPVAQPRISSVATAVKDLWLGSHSPCMYPLCTKVMGMELDPSPQALSVSQDSGSAISVCRN